MKRFFSPISSKLPQSSSSAQNAPRVEENLNQLEETHHSAKRLKQGVDLDSLPADPKKRIPIRDYHPDERDEIRRAYIQRGPHQPRSREFSQSDISGLKHSFNRKWFKKYHDWLEYSVTEDAAYCLCCYLFQDESIHQGGGETFSSIRFRSWHKKKRLDTHIAAFVKLSNQTKLEHKIRLKASIEVARLLLNQGLAFRVHREDESSLNKGNFLEILSWYAKRCDKIGELVLKKAPKNDQMTSHKIQKDIVIACKLETIKAIMEDLNGDYFSLLVDESCDISRKEQMAIVLRYVDRKGSVVERFIGIIHAHDTSVLCLKEAIINYLAQHSLSLSFIRGKCYDGASNMQGSLSGLKVLIQQESKSAHAIHCFAHQLQLTLVGVSKKCLQVGELVLLVSNVLNVVGGSFKRMDELQESQAKKVQVALDMGEVESGKGLNQELGLARAANTRWGSHYKSFKNFISMFGSITNVLDTIVVDSESVEEKAKATRYLKVCQTFEIAFLLHLMRDILVITNELNESLQKKEQDIANAILLVKVVKKRLQDLRNEGWDSLVENVSAFCVKYDILIPNFEEFYVNFGRSRRKVAEYTISHHYRVEVFFKIIDWQLQELNDCFNEVRTDFLIGVACLNPVDSFSSFDIKNVLRMVELYPDDFGENVMVTLRNQLETYIVDVDKRFSNLKGLGNLSEMLVKVKKHLNYPLVFRLIKFALLLPVATATVERAFPAMKLIKSELRNRMDDDFLSSCMVPYVEKRIFNTISDESIMNRFQEMKTRRIEL
ncbi:uncharacterized protein LOC125807502 [Solanum verrucosum]|uniref:uncharacterized protein LOC125807502 n=1 Tax=Solanum verrucosum TaxID=315347 RepID=UPI0020D1A82C|nr:uncharacterized protein LOC125807502 [Solanum verrucosum]